MVNVTLMDEKSSGSTLGGDNIRDQGPPYANKADKAGGSVWGAMIEAVAKGRGRKNISQRQSCVLLGSGGLHEQT